MAFSFDNVHSSDAADCWSFHYNRVCDCILLQYAEHAVVTLYYCTALGSMHSGAKFYFFIITGNVQGDTLEGICWLYHLQLDVQGDTLPRILFSPSG